ncbi:T9SS type B sorting domain-containing protein [Apibacter sp. HY039]|uniref:T9SS type B sorting domain-containing protein n=1 Tax=Apibacter sp. HY039 TaxID=2501476 RepID=UPI000FEC1876|nr:T9SS type B sorting domain-containing protein [Apibacter sp. HY039]
MGIRILPYYIILSCLLGSFSLLSAQIISSSAINIKDQNGNSGSVLVNCDYKFDINGCISLTAEYPEINSSTDYSVTSINYSPIGNFSEGNEILIDSDDKWSNVQNLPFNFCFYGKTYNSIVVGDNGVISFDTESAGTECPYTIAGSIPSEALIHNAIFGAYHDMTNDNDVFGCTSDCGKISLYTTGTAPFRKAVVNYYRMNHFGCENVKSTLQIVLYETTNIIEVYIKDKPYTCDIGNEKRALIGISNEDGSKGISPAGRNTGIWETQNEAWRFTPSGANSTSVKWYDSNHKNIGTGSTVNICNRENQSVSVEVTYNTCTPVTLTNSININYSSDYPVIKSVIHNECYEGETPNQLVDFENLIPEAVGSQTGLKTTLHKTLSDAKNGINPVSGLNTYLMNTLTQTFYLRAQRSDSCFDTSVLTINLKRKPTLTEGKAIIVCSESTSGSELIYLGNYNAQITGYESWMSLSYYNSYEDATKGINPITSLQLSNTTKVYVKASNPDMTECFSIIPVSFTLLHAIKADSIEVNLCDDDLDGKVIYDLTSYQNTVENNQSFSFSYYVSQKNAEEGVNPISDPKNYSIQNNTIIYVKIEQDGACSTIKTITFKFKNTGVSNLTVITCDDGTGKAIVNLESYYNQMAENADITLEGIYLTYQGAASKDLSQKISNLSSFTVIAPSTTVYVRFTDNSTSCNFIRSIEFKIIQKIEKKPEYYICDINNKGEVNYYLPYLNSIYLAGYPTSSITYYSSLEDYNSGKNPITYILVKGETTVYVKVNVISGCAYLYKVNLKLKPFTVNNVENIAVCDQENDGKETYNLNSLPTLFNLSNYITIFYYSSEESALVEYKPIVSTSAYLITAATSKIYMRINYAGTCPTIIPVQFDLIESVVTNDLSPINVCDKDLNQTEIVDLSSSITESGIDSSKISTDFYLSQAGAEEQKTTEKINDIKNFVVNKQVTTVYIRFQNKSTGCYSIKPLNIIMNTYPVVIKSGLYVCDFANDGKENISLSSLNSQLVNDTKGFSFSYYTTEENALNLQNEITTYDVTTSTTLYVRISSNSACYVIQKINFQLSSPPTVYSQVIEICDNNADNKEVVDLTLYEKPLVNNTVNTYTFTYYISYESAYQNSQSINNAKNYTITSFPATIYVRVQNSLNCFSIAELNFNTANIINAKNGIANLCDNNSDMQEYVDITSYVSNMLISTDQNITISYYKTEQGANSKNSADLIDNPEKYSATFAQEYVWLRFDNPDTGCYTIRSLEINITPLPKLINGKYLVCDTNIDNRFTLNLDDLRYVVIFNPDGFTFTYFHSISDAQNNNNQITDFQNYTVEKFNKDIVVKATNEFGCSSIRTVTLYTADKIPVSAESVIIENCDNDFDGITSFDLTSVTSDITKDSTAIFTFYSTLIDAQNQTNSISNPSSYSNINPVNDMVYVRISSTKYCPSLSSINLKVLPVPVSPLEKDLKICPNSILVLNADTGNEEDYYEWSTGDKGYNLHSITINNAGTYQVTITGTNGCKYTYKTTVTEYSKIVITDLFEGDDYITVIAEGPQPLEYSMDLINWQDQNTFYNLKPGVYTFYVRSKANGCISVQKKGVIFKVTNTITPNGDGFNDNWQLCGLENFDSQPSKIKIFDRYGKEVFSQSSNTCFVWNGFYLGRPLPTTSYWYVIDIIDGRQFTGWILLRNYDEDFR